MKVGWDGGKDSIKLSVVGLKIKKVLRKKSKGQFMQKLHIKGWKSRINHKNKWSNKK